jgi:ubiquinone/menaquinone biosynthesis C-methylase UbiE
LKINRKDVKAANQKLYDAVADKYERLDGRRNAQMDMWLSNTLTELRKKTSGGRLLDLGTGSGLVARCAKGVFSEITGIDLSCRILKLNRSVLDYPIVADVDFLPFSDGRFDMITCFAVLHHLFDFNQLAAEAARVIGPGGIFYCDHDLDIDFCRRFALPLMLYRKFHNAQKKYRNASDEISEELYTLTEYGENGIDSFSITRLFRENGFYVTHGFHWFGLNRITDCAFKAKTYRRGFAPLFRMVAVKKG